MKAIKFALNRKAAPHLSIDEFLSLAARLGFDGVELRNDIEGQDLQSRLSSHDIKTKLEEYDISLASINALQRFNDFTEQTAKEADALFEYASNAGATGVVLCPVVDANHGLSDEQAYQNLRYALENLIPVLKKHQIIGYIEPLGMPASTMRLQKIADDAITDVSQTIEDANAYLQICYDSFHYYISNDDSPISDKTGLIHLSGIVRDDCPVHELVDDDRGFVYDNDLAQNIAQAQKHINHGYHGFISIEPFDPNIIHDNHLEENIQRCFDYLKDQLKLS